MVLCCTGKHEAGPRRGDIVNKMELAVVPVWFRHEVLPHEHIGRARVDSLSQALEITDNIELDIGGRVPAALDSKHTSHQVRATAVPADGKGLAYPSETEQGM